MSVIKKLFAEDLVFKVCVLIFTVGFIITVIVLLTIDPTDNEVESDKTLRLSIVHLNDFHSRFDEVSLSGDTCKNTSTCVGGIARVKTLVNQLKSMKNFVLLNAGDNYQGTLYFTLFKWPLIRTILNMFPFDAITLGNHEFDNQMSGLVPFMETMNAPFVVSNINDTLEPSMQNLYTKSIVITREGKKIGIIGVILPTTNTIASTGNLSFFDEVTSVNAEAKRLVDEESVFTNIVLSHCGYDIDKIIADKAQNKIGVIVGAHSHSLLYTGSAPSGEAPVGKYPTVIRQINGDKILVVQASAFTKYLGNISVSYDDNGKVADWEGASIFVSNDIAKDPDVEKEIAPYKEQVHTYESKIIGYTEVLLDNSQCYTAECNMGNLYADAMADYYMNQATGKKPTIAFTNPGGLRTSINIGNISYSDLLLSQPFSNTFDLIEIKGEYVRELYEFGANYQYRSPRASSPYYLLQTSGVQVKINLNLPAGQRVISLKVLCQDCDDGKYENIIFDKTYKMVVNSFLTTGGDGFTMIPDNAISVATGPLDTIVLEEYIRKKSPINIGIEERIKIYGKL